MPQLGAWVNGASPSCSCYRHKPRATYITREIPTTYGLKRLLVVFRPTVSFRGPVDGAAAALATRCEVPMRSINHCVPDNLLSCVCLPLSQTQRRVAQHVVQVRSCAAASRVRSCTLSLASCSPQRGRLVGNVRHSSARLPLKLRHVKRFNAMRT